MESRCIRDDLRPSIGDGIHTVARAALSGLVPLAGGTLAELLSSSIAPPISRRRDEWLIYLADGLQLLNDRVENFDWNQRMQDPSFVSLVIEACQIAVRNHREEKLRALRNGILNAAVGIDVAEDVRFAFLALIDRFTASHLDVLGFAYFPWGWIERNGVNFTPLPRGWSARKSCLLEYQKDPLFLDMVIADLQAARLIEAHPFTALDNSMSPTKTSLDHTSSLGGRFYRFFSEPECLQTETEAQRRKMSAQRGST